LTTSGQCKADIINLSFIKCNGALSDSQLKLNRTGDFVSLTTTKETSEPKMGGQRGKGRPVERAQGRRGLSQSAPWGGGKQHLQLTTQITENYL